MHVRSQFPSRKRSTASHDPGTRMQAIFSPTTGPDSMILNLGTAVAGYIGSVAGRRLPQPVHKTSGSMASNRAGGSKDKTTGKAGTKARKTSGKAGAKARSTNEAKA